MVRGEWGRGGPAPNEGGAGGARRLRAWIGLARVAPRSTRELPSIKQNQTAIVHFNASQI